MTTKTHNRHYQPFPHIAEREHREAYQLVKGALLIALVLSAMALLWVWPVPELPR